MPVKHSEKFKRDAVALVESGVSRRQVCLDLGVSKPALVAWVRNAQLAALGFEPPAGAEDRREIAAADEREHQRASPPVLPEGHGPVPLVGGGPRSGSSRAQ